MLKFLLVLSFPGVIEISPCTEICFLLNFCQDTLVLTFNYFVGMKSSREQKEQGEMSAQEK